MISKSDIKFIDKYIDKSRFAGKTILVTGATGFIGRNLVRYFVENSKVVAVCRNKEKATYIYNELQENDNLCFYYGDLYSPIRIEGNIDYIFHTASPSTTGLFQKIPYDVGACNTVGTYHVLNLAREKMAKGVLFTSSGAVYGNEKDEGGSLSEKEFFPIDSLDISSCYALGKKMGENLCVSFASQYHLPVNIVRISHTYGPGIDLNDGHVYSDFVRSILEGGNLVIRGSGNARRPFCYISDALIAFFLIITSGTYGEAYNMANISQMISIRDLADLLCNKAFPEKHLSYKVLGNGDDIEANWSECWPDTRKLEALGWKPQIDIVEGFKRTVAYEMRDR